MSLFRCNTHVSQSGLLIFCLQFAFLQSVSMHSAWGQGGEPEKQTQQPNGQAKQDEKPESLKIVIADEPKTIDPATTVYKPLAKKVTVSFDETSIREVVAWLRKEVGITVLLDEADLSDANILLSEPVTDRLNKEPLYLLLDRLQAISLGWYVEDDILHITTQAVAMEHLSTVPHNVGNFLDKDFNPADLTESIISGTDGSRWEEQGGVGTLVLLGDVLFIRQSDDMHRKVSGILQALEKHGRRTFIDDPSEHESLRQKLMQKVSVEFNDTPLSEAIAELTQKTSADIRIDVASFRQARIRDREPVSLKLSDQKLSSVLQALVAKLRLTWTLQNGSIMITTEGTAANLLKAAVYDVRDLARNEDEAVALQDAIVMQTAGGWDVDGGNGTITFARPGVMVVRHTEKTLGSVLTLLETYRKALKISKVRNRNQIDPKEPITEYYRMPAVIAADLELWLKQLIEPKSWKSERNQEAIGTVVRLASTPALVGPNKVVLQKIKEDVEVRNGLVLDYSVLIVHQTRETHEKIRELIYKIENGSTIKSTDGGQGGGFGGGFFSIRNKVKKTLGDKTLGQKMPKSKR